jgi:hypothetical protein
LHRAVTFAASRPLPELGARLTHTLRELYPEPQDRDDPAPTMDGAKHLTVTAEIVEVVVKRLPKVASADIAGWRNEHFQFLLRHGFASVLARHAEAYHVVELTDTVCQWLSIARGVAPAKPGTEDLTPEEMALRPIAIPLILYSVMTKAGLLQHTEKHLYVGAQTTASFFTAHGQYGISCPHGTELVTHTVQFLADTAPGRVWLKGDVRNAHGTFKRSSAVETSRRQFPHLHCAIRNAYRRSSTVVFRDADGDPLMCLSRTGSKQGDPLGAHMFACSFSHVLISIRSKWPDAIVLAIMDDLHVNCRPDQVEAIFRDLEEMCAEIELELHPGKSELWLPDGALPSDILPEITKRDGVGLVIVGNPVGQTSSSGHT